MRFGPQGSTTTANLSPYDAMLQVSQASGIPISDVTAIQNGMGLSPAEMMPYIVNLGAAHQANPDQNAGWLAGNVLGAKPDQIAAINKTDTANKSKAGQTGAFTDIFGDMFEVIYPFFMFTLGAVALIGFVIVTLVGISKSPVGRSLSSGAAAGAGFAALAK